MESTDQQMVDPPQPLTPDQLRTKKLFKQTYYFSQGSANLQSLIFKYLIAVDAFPHSELLYESVPEYLDLNLPKRHIITKDKSGEIASEYARLVAQYNLGGENPKNIVPQILLGIAKRDIKFMITGRPQGSEMIDPFESHIRRYILEGEPTSSTAFDALFSQARIIYNDLHDTRDVRGPGIMDNYFVKKLSNAYAEHNDVQLRQEEAGIFSEIKPPELLSLTNQLWEYRHPGQSFAPSQTATA